MRRVAATALVCALAVTGVVRSHLWPLTLLVLLGAASGVLVAVGQETDLDAGRDTRADHRADRFVRLPAVAAVLVLVLVGIGQLGLVGLLLGGTLLVLSPAFASPRNEHQP